MSDASVSSTLKRLRDECDSDSGTEAHADAAPTADDGTPCAPEPVPPYHWNRRHRLFSRFDEGILLDKRLFPPPFLDPSFATPTHALILSLLPTTPYPIQQRCGTL